MRDLLKWPLYEYMMPLKPTSTQCSCLEGHPSYKTLLHAHNFLLHQNTLITLKRVHYVVREDLNEKVVTGNLPILPVVGNAGDKPSIAQMKQLAGAVAGSVHVVGDVQLEEGRNALLVTREGPSVILRYGSKGPRARTDQQSRQALALVHTAVYIITRIKSVYGDSYQCTPVLTRPSSQ